MLGTLIRTQILENVYGIKFVVTFIVCTLLVIAATITGIGRFEAQLSEEQKIISINRGNLQEAGSWHDAARNGIKVIKPTTALGIFSSGLEESVGRTATVREGDFPHMEDSIYSTAPIFAVFGDLDLTFIIKIVISLFAILFTYDMISGEKENGTLKLCLSNPVPRNTYLLGKSIGSFVSLLIPLLIPLLLGMLLIMTLGNVSFSGDDWARLGLLTLSYVLYMLAFFCAGLFVSALTKKSAISFLILLFVWVLFVLVIPKASMMIADEVYPIPSINEVRAQQFQLQRDFRQQTWERTSEEFQKLQGTVSREERWRKMREIRNTIRAELEPIYLQQNEKLYSDFKQQQANLTNLAMSISRVSPASALTYVGLNMAGTGFHNQENFLSQLTSYRERFTEYVEQQQEKEEQRGGGFMHGSSEQGQLDLTGIPEFRFVNMSIGESINLTLIDLMMMVIISIIFYTLGFVLFIRYDVR
ncbi:MAG TPA: ABC transporter permease subunit [Acidobacteriota bacterium]|nr:ABC transporter permease subunit [Acidobacteriota bacterium]